MTAREIAEKTWELWYDYYREGDLGSKEILDIIENDIKALTIPVCVDQSERLVCDMCGSSNLEECGSNEYSCEKCGHFPITQS